MVWQDATMQGQEQRHSARVRRLRNSPTEAEHRLWQYLRGRQVSGCKFRRQHPFGRFILDFACLERKVVIELDGGHHADTLRYDRERTKYLEEAGFVVLRFWNNDVLGNAEGVIDVITAALQKATPSPPNPPLEGEG
ncbi:DUF559 domain-containing protein [Lysobacter panacisoli]|uniref:DUF559 domain-containing protein n=2 Tax=Lysobacter panacisoli TaxID=1255263 RepID=A0ABP9LRT4_9GAMM